MNLEVDPLAARYPGLDAGIVTVLEAARAAGLPPMIELDAGAMRERVRSGDRLCAAGPDLLDVEDLVIYGGLPARRYVPFRLRTSAVLVWFHGGGWVTGDLGYSDAFCRLLADTVGCEVCSVAYRLAPEHPFPAAIDDAIASVRWAGQRGAQVIVAGDSAGANLAAVAAQQLKADPQVRVIGQLLVYPVLDCDITRPSYLRNMGLVLGPMEMTWFFDRYVPDEADRQSPRFAPLRAPDLRGLAPAVLAVAGHDPLYDEGVRYAQLLQAAGVAVTWLDFTSLVHGFLRFTAPVAAAADAATRIVTATADMVHAVTT